MGDQRKIQCLMHWMDNWGEGGSSVPGFVLKPGDWKYGGSSLWFIQAEAGLESFAPICLRMFRAH